MKFDIRVIFILPMIAYEILLIISLVHSKIHDQDISKSYRQICEFIGDILSDDVAMFIIVVVVLGVVSMFVQSRK